EIELRFETKRNSPRRNVLALAITTACLGQIPKQLVKTVRGRLPFPPVRCLSSAFNRRLTLLPSSARFRHFLQTRTAPARCDFTIINSEGFFIPSIWARRDQLPAASR